MSAFGKRLALLNGLDGALRRRTWTVKRLDETYFVQNAAPWLRPSSIPVRTAHAKGCKR